ncbi:MAG: hypothetical protein ACKPKO_47065, partial [Candidatus Fonsibacter sp.]
RNSLSHIKFATPTSCEPLPMMTTTSSLSPPRTVPLLMSWWFHPAAIVWPSDSRLQFQVIAAGLAVQQYLH